MTLSHIKILIARKIHVSADFVIVKLDSFLAVWSKNVSNRFLNESFWISPTSFVNTLLYIFVFCSRKISDFLWITFIKKCCKASFQVQASVKFKKSGFINRKTLKFLMGYLNVYPVSIEIITI